LNEKVGEFFNRIIVEREYFPAVSLVLFFDGDCGFCTRSVRFVYEYDEKGLIDFAPLQGELAGKFSLKGYSEKGGGSMVILREEDGEIFTKGEALIELGKVLGGVFRVLAVVFSFFPKGLRNRLYDLVAKNRYKLSGACELPDEGLRKRMRS
jgi:predicted DCC family thiol-disulfide oxidoreductase YuxK